MTKKSTIILASSLVLLLAGTGLVANRQLIKKQQANAVISRQEHSKKQKQALQQTTGLTVRSDLVSKPSPKAVSQEMITDGQKLLENRQLTVNQVSYFDFNALAIGDFSSLAGQWTDANGYQFEFSPQGLVGQDDLSITSLTYDINGEAVSQINRHSGGGFILHYYPAGTEIPSWHFQITQSDPSDIGRDRLVATQINRFDYESTNQFVSSVFYKTSDSYRQSTEDTSSSEATVEASPTSELETSDSLESSSGSTTESSSVIDTQQNESKLTVTAIE